MTYPLVTSDHTILYEAGRVHIRLMCVSNLGWTWFEELVVCALMCYCICFLSIKYWRCISLSTCPFPWKLKKNVKARPRCLAFVSPATDPLFIPKSINLQLILQPDRAIAGPRLFTVALHSVIGDWCYQPPLILWPMVCWWTASPHRCTIFIAYP